MNKKTKIVPINELPSASSVEDDDILIKSNFENTEKMTANQLQEYVNRKRKHADWKETDQKSDAYIENKPTSLSADGGNADTVNGHTVESDVPPNAKFTDTIYTHPNSGVTASTYKSVTVDSKGHVTGGTNPTTIGGFGITDAASKTELENEVTRSTNKENELETKKANLESPTFTGVPKVPTASTETNTTQAASTAFVHSSVNSHNSSTSSHSDIREFIKDLNRRLNALADSDDTTLDQMSEIVTYIKSNKSLIDNITTTKVNVADIIDNLTSVSTNKPLSAKQGKLLNDLINSLKSSVGTKVENISGDSIIGVVKTGNNYSVTHKDITRSNTTSSVTPAHGNSFTAVKSILTDNKGHITSVNTTTVTLPNEQDLSSSNIVFSSGDSASPTAWANVAVMESGEKHSSLLNKISTMFKNVRWLYKMLGTSDISKIGNGTVTGAISVLNTDLPFLSNFSYKERIDNTSYTAEKECAVYVNIVFNSTLYGYATTKINTIYVDNRQGTGIENTEFGHTVFLKPGDLLEVSGSGVKAYSFRVYE